jgi:NADP-dependent aldehyde dehydrogenase
MPITGQLIIGFQRVGSASGFRGRDPLRNTPLEPTFAAAESLQVARACELAERAFDAYRSVGLESRARFLEVCAENLLALGEELLERAALETALPRARLEGERARTVNQLRLFAAVVRQGDWLGLRVDPALPDRKPLPRSDLRLRKIALGPVAVFGASNFPLAFSAAGGDVAAALGAGCPVIVKAHPAHPGTSELTAAAISDAAQSCGLPDGTYSHLSGPSNALGSALVQHPAIKAVAFTGSRQGGLALSVLAAARAEPIPMYAEMSSINPIIILPNALQARAESIAKGFVASLTLGAGQFCTNPGLVLVLDGPEVQRFLAAASEALREFSPSTMLTENISANYRSGVERMRCAPNVSQVAQGRSGHAHEAHGALFSVRAQEFLANETLRHEVFGPSSLVVLCRDSAEMRRVVDSLEGQLTATLQVEPGDYDDARPLLAALERRAGRILVNGWPTGVEVTHAMVHGGPFPATSDSRTTSVGTLAIERFLRPVCYQDMPAALLPPELRDDAQPRYRTLIEGKFL